MEEESTQIAKEEIRFWLFCFQSKHEYIARLKTLYLNKNIIYDLKERD